MFVDLMEKKMTTTKFQFVSGIAYGIVCSLSMIVVWKCYEKYIHLYKKMSKGSIRQAEYVMAVICRKDLKMSSGKIAAQMSHAAVGAYRKALKKNPKLTKQWKEIGMPRTFFKVSDEETLAAFYYEAKAKSLPVIIIADAGRTQIARGSVTAVAIGPATTSEVEEIVSSLDALE